MILRTLLIILISAVLIGNGLLIHKTIESQETERAELIAESVARLLANVPPHDAAQIRELAAREAERWGVSIVVSGGGSLRPITIPAPRAHASAHVMTGTAVILNQMQDGMPRTVQVFASPDHSLLNAINTNLLTLMIAVTMVGLFILMEAHHRRGRRALDRLLEAVDDGQVSPTVYSKWRKPDYKPEGPRWPAFRTVQRIEAIGQAVIQARQRNNIERERIRQREAVHEETEKRLAVQAHDLRAPLANIHAYAVAASRRLTHSGDRESPEYCNIAGILEACNAMELIVSDHLEVRRASIGGTNAVEVVERAVLLHQQIADKKMVTILLRVDERVPRRMRVKETSLWHGVSNLLSNAIRFSPDGSVIHVRMGPSGNERHQWAIDVMDNGPGVPNGWQERIFEEGAQAEKGIAVAAAGAETQNGVGLGLSAARAFARWEWGDANVMRGAHSGSGAWFRWEWKDRGVENDVAEQSPSTVWISIPDDPDLEREIATHVKRVVGALVVIGRESINVGQIDLALVSRDVWTTKAPDVPYLVFSDHALHFSPINRTRLARWVTTREVHQALHTKPTLPQISRKSVRTDGALLLVDDIALNNEAIAELIRALSGDAEKLEIRMAVGAAEARAALAEHGDRIWGMIADYQMPGESGLQLISWVQHEHPEIRCAMITGDQQPEIQQRALEAGAEVVLGRPIDEKELIRFLKPEAPQTGLRQPNRNRAVMPAVSPKRFREGIGNLIAKALHAARENDRRSLLGVLHAARGSCAMLQMEEWVIRFEKMEHHLREGGDVQDVTTMLKQLEQHHETAGNHRH